MVWEFGISRCKLLCTEQINNKLLLHSTGNYIQHLLIYHNRKDYGKNVYMYICQRRQWHPTPVLLPGKSHGRKSLVGCSPWGHEESDTTKLLHFHFSLLCIGEGNGNPLQCSCLENPRDGVAQSWTRLKWLSSSSSMHICITKALWYTAKINTTL